MGKFSALAFCYWLALSPCFAKFVLPLNNRSQLALSTVKEYCAEVGFINHLFHFKYNLLAKISALIGWEHLNPHHTEQKVEIERKKLKWNWLTDWDAGKSQNHMNFSRAITSGPVPALFLSKDEVNDFVLTGITVMVKQALNRQKSPKTTADTQDVSKCYWFWCKILILRNTYRYKSTISLSSY